MQKSCLAILSLLFALILITACHNENPEQKNLSQEDLKEPLMEANKHVVKTEARHIEDFLRRYKWDITETGSGLRYMIYYHGKGEKAVKGKLAIIDYTASFITGDVVYSSENDGLMTFIIGKGEVISGLEEGILLMNVGGKAKFIIPSHLAYGLIGDDKSIPGKATLIYDIQLLELK